MPKLRDETNLRNMLFIWILAFTARGRTSSRDSESLRRFRPFGGCRVGIPRHVIGVVEQPDNPRKALSFIGIYERPAGLLRRARCAFETGFSTRLLEAAAGTRNLSRIRGNQPPRLAESASR